jgi:hypothetical protein
MSLQHVTYIFIWEDKFSVRTSQETYYVSATKPNRLMLFRETVAVYFENRREHSVGRMQSFLIFKQVVHVVNTVLYRVTCL